MAKTLLSTRVLQRAASAAFIGAIASAVSSASAATQTWSGTNSGVWDTSALNWDAGADAWTSSNDALFTGTPTNNVTAATGLTINSITLDNTFTGSVTITGGNTVPGATTISGGTLNLKSNTGLGASAITVNSGGTLAINPGTASTTVSNNISGAGLVTAQDPAGAGGNTLQLGGNYSGFTGTLNILAGASNFGKVNFSNATQANVISSSATIQVQNGATLYLNKGLNYGASIQLYGTGNAELSNNGSTLGALRLEAGANQTGTVTLFANSSIGVNASAATISGVIGESGGSFGFTKGGNNSLTLSGANTFSGTTTHAASSGTLRLANSLALQNSTLSYTGAAALVFDSTVATHAFTLGGLTGTSNIALTDNGSNAVALTVGNNNTSPAAYSGVLSGGGSLTKVGTGTLTLSSANTYTGATTVNNGTLLVSGSGNINGSSGITINGSSAKYSKTSTSAGTVPITLTQGTLDGTGTVGAVTVGNGTGGIVTNGNGNGGTAALTMSSLTFSGAGTISLNKANDTSTVALAVTGAFATTPANGQITLNVLTAPTWANGSTYDLISYGSFSGANTDFTLGTVTGLGVRQSATLGNTGAGSGFITLAITGNTPVWTGAANANWTTTAQPAPFNWMLQPAGTTTQFLTNDQVLFDDTATGLTAINIADASVSPASVVFNNSSKNYSVSSVGGFGIASGSISKSGTGSLTLRTANTYSGGTALNAGTLNINNASAIGTGTLTIAAGTTIDNTSGSAITLSTNNAQIWNGDFAFGGSNDLNLGTGAVTLASSLHLTTNGTATLTVGGTIGGTGAGLFKEGTGTLSLNGANTFDGGVTIDAGTVRAGNALALGPSTNSLTFGASSNGKLQVNGNAITVGALNGDSTATIENSNATNGALTVSSGSFAGTIQNGSAGTLALTMSGAGTFALTGANTYSGGTTLGTGTISVSGNSPFGTGTVTTGGGTISTSAAATISNAITLNGATIFTATGGTMVLSGNITGSPTFWTLNPTNKITLGGTNSMTTSAGFNTGAGSLDITGSTTIDGGANVNAGYATIGNGADSTTTLLSGGSLIINGTTNATKPNTIVGQNISNSTLNVGATDKSSSGTLTIGGNTGFVLGNNNASSTGTLSIYSGTVTITAGSATLQNVQNFIAMGRDNATGIINLNGGTLATGRQFVRDGSGGGTVGAGTATFNFNGGTLQAQADQTQGNGWFETATTGNFQVVTTNVEEGGAIIDTNGFTVNIQSVLAHAGSNAIDGGLTKIGAGTLSLGSIDPSFTGDTFTGNVAVNAGTLSLASNITLNSTIVLSLASNTTLDLGFISGSQTVQELFLNGTAVAPGTYSSSDLNTLGSSSSITFTSFGGTLTVAAVPEPATMALISIGLVCILFGFRRHGRKLKA
jgi:autotransporter-associated beta strand protein